MAAKQMALTAALKAFARVDSGMSGNSEVVESIATLIDHLVFINPNIALASQDIDMRLGHPVRVRLTAIGIAEGQMYAGKFFVLQQHANHARQSQICAEGQFTDAVAVLIGVAIFPEFLLQILARALRVNQAGFLDFQNQWSGLQVAILAVKVVAGCGVTYKSAVH